MNKKRLNISRRKMLKGTATGIGATLGPFAASAEGNPQRRSNRIIEENSKPGTHEWQLQYTSFDTPVTMASYPMVRYLRSVSIEGYVSKTSVLPEESLDFKVSMRDAGRFRIDFLRPGKYPAGHDPGGRTFGVNPHVQQIRANVINRMLKDSMRK